jgi:hypothetical protein
MGFAYSNESFPLTIGELGKLDPLMLKEWVLLPKSFSYLVIFGLILAAIVQRRQGHISRPAIVANAFLLWQIFYGEWNRLPEWLQWYLNIGTICALVALGSYLLKESLPTDFYQFCYYVYGSITILVLIWSWMGESDVLLLSLSPIIFAIALIWIFSHVIPGRPRTRRRKYYGR